MRKIFTLLSLMLLFSAGAQAQSYVSTFYSNAGNPGGAINTDANDAPGLNGWTNLILGPKSANVWSPTVAIPFPFQFFGQTVTHLKASQNMVVTFDTLSAILPGNNAALPTATLPDLSIAGLWDAFTGSAPTGSGDDIRYKVFGTAPNRQFWIKWYSFEYGSPALSFAYNCIVLEEGTNKVYVVDQYSNTTPALTATVGLQQNSTTAVQFGAPTLTHGSNSPNTPDNDYYEFSPVSAGLNLEVLSATVAPVVNVGCGSTLVPVKIKLRNLGTLPATGILGSFSVDGGAPITPEAIAGTLLTGDTLSYTFTTLANLTAAGPHVITAGATVIGDLNNNNDFKTAASVTIVPLVPSLAAVNFTGFTGANLGTVFPGWSEGTGTTAPTGTTSGWTSDDFGNVVGGPNGTATKVNLFNTGDEAWIISPRFTAATNTQLSFDLALTNWNATTSASFGSDDFLKVMVSTDCGATYTALATYNSASTISNTGQNVTFSLAPYAGQSVIVGFYISEGTVDDVADIDVFVDNIQINALSLIDMGVTQIVTPILQTCADSTATIAVEVKNFGIVPIDFAVNNVTVNASITGINAGNYSTTINSGTLAVNGSQVVTVTSTAVMFNGGSTTISASTVVAGDGSAANDGASKTVTVLGEVNTPVVNNFTGYTGSNLGTLYPGWSEASGTTTLTFGASDWTGKNFGNVAGANGTAANFNIYLPGRTAWVLTPPISLPSFSELTFDLALTNWNATTASDFGSDDKFRVLISTNCGQTFTQLAQYDSTTTPISNTGQAEAFNLTSYGGQTVIIGFQASEGTFDDNEDIDVFVDNVNVRELVAFDATPLAFVSLPNLTCGDSFQTGAVIVRSKGQALASNIPVSVDVVSSTGTQTFNVVVPGPLAANQQDTVTFGPFSTIAGGTYSFEATSALTGDQDLTNDSVLTSRTYAVVAPPITDVSNDEICLGDSIEASVDPLPYTQYFWYNVPVGGTPIATGDTVVFAPVVNTTYYSEAVAAKQNLGPASNAIGAGAFGAFYAEGMVFSALSDMVLNSVRVYPNGAGNVTINLESSALSTLNTKTFVIPAGVTDTTLQLDFFVPAGTGYRLTPGGTDIAAGLFRNTAGGVYPYTVAGLASITGPINNFAGYFYFFYDWKVSTSICPSERGSTSVAVLPIADADFTFAATELTVAFTDASASSDSVLYLFGDGASSTLASPSHTYLLPGTYAVTQIAYRGSCSPDTITKSVVVTCTPPAADFNVTTGNLTASFVTLTTGADSVKYTFGDGTSTTASNPTHLYAAVGTYNVCQIIYDVCGRDTLCENVVITCVAAQAGFTFTAAGTVASFTNAAVGADSVRYIFPSGATSSNPNPTFDFGASGTYPVQQIAYNICGADTFFLEVSVVRSSIDDLLDLSSLSIYPNPTHGDFALDMILRKPANVTVDVVNASGQVVLSQTFDKVSGNFSHEFVSNKLAAGLYIVRLSISGEQVLRKLQVE